MNKQGIWLFSLTVFIFLCIVLVLPLSYPTASTEALSDPTGLVAVTPSKPLKDIPLPPSRSVTSVLFWTARESTILSNTHLQLQITDANTGEIVATEVEMFLTVFNPSTKTLRFSFPVLRNTRNSSYVVSLTLQNASDTELLAIRGTLQDPEDTTSAKVGVQVIERRSLFSILYEKLYHGKTDGEDIYYYWARGGQIASGDNPYVCSLDDTCINHKNPGHFPLFYLLSAGAIKLGFSEFPAWIALWRPIFLFCYMFTGIFLFWTLARNKQYALAVFALFFWLFNRWSLYVIRVGHVDFLALLFLTLSLVFFEKKKAWSVILFSLSLSIKQVAIFLAPLYFILIWVRTEKEKRLKKVLRYAGVMTIVPLLSLLPFITDNPRAVAKGLLFSATRTSEANMGAAPLVSFLKIQGSVGVVPMAFLMICIYIAAYRKKLSLAQGGLAIMLVFLAFNTVIFNQYFLWFIPFLSLAFGKRKQELK